MPVPRPARRQIRSHPCQRDVHDVGSALELLGAGARHGAIEEQTDLQREARVGMREIRHDATRRRRPNRSNADAVERQRVLARCAEGEQRDLGVPAQLAQQVQDATLIATPCRRGITRREEQEGNPGSGSPRPHTPRPTL